LSQLFWSQFEDLAERRHAQKFEDHEANRQVGMSVHCLLDSIVAGLS
jgi:hypothetical protein